MMMMWFTSLSPPSIVPEHSSTLLNLGWQQNGFHDDCNDHFIYQKVAVVDCPLTETSLCKSNLQF